MVLGGPMTGEAFLADVEQVLIPTAPTRRHRRDGQLARPQDRRSACRDRRRRRSALPAAALLARHEPDRVKPWQARRRGAGIASQSGPLGP
jgi:hypothetical protein